MPYLLPWAGSLGRSPACCCWMLTLEVGRAPRPACIEPALNILPREGKDKLWGP